MKIVEQNKSGPV